MTDEMKDELKRQSEAARKSWYEAMDKARDEGRKATREAEVIMGVAELLVVYKAADQRVADHVSKDLPALPSGWTWDEWGRACSDYPNVTAHVVDGSIEFEDHDENERMRRPIAVVLAVIASKDSK